MNHNPLVSVIIPNYCHSQYLDLRIQSILNQTYTNYEIIILDDCSPDNGASREVIEKYRSNSHVSHIVYNETNSGSTFKQWEKGLQLAKGSLIWIAESDDYCEADFLHKCVVKYSEHSNVAFVYVNSILVDSKGHTLNIKDTAEKIPDKAFNGCDFIRNYMCFENAVWNASAVVFRRDYSLDVSRMYMEYKAAGDHLFWVLLAEKGSVVHLSEHLNYFRQHQQKVTPEKSKLGISHLEELRTLQYIKQKGYLDVLTELKAYAIYVFQIKTCEYKSEEIRRSLLLKWKQSNKYMYNVSLLLVPFVKLKRKIRSLLCALF